MPQVNPLISPEALLALQESASLVLIDARFGKEKYTESHLKGAHYVDLNLQLSHIQEDAADGGRHPLPDPIAFAKTLGSLGITPDSHVVVYDDKSGAMSAARFWWMLKAMGHEKIQVLDGGMDAALKLGFPVSSGIEKTIPTATYPVDKWKLPLSDLEEVERVAQSQDHVVVDVRETDRYLGKTEPIDLIAGHIPGAVNVPFAENLDKEGFFLPAQALHDKYKEAFKTVPPENIIVQCGSGVTACHTLLALAHAGMEIPKLYVGSWSEWSRNDKPIAGENG